MKEISPLPSQVKMLSTLFLAGMTDFDLVLLIQPRRRPSCPSSYLKVSINENSTVNAMYGALRVYLSLVFT